VLAPCELPGVEGEDGADLAGGEGAAGAGPAPAGACELAAGVEGLEPAGGDGVGAGVTAGG
jgi:hypothetical protein